MRKVATKPPSFPRAVADAPIRSQPGVRWQVVCGDEGHWRAGLYSPAASRLDEVEELERHDCPELFLLVGGRVTLVLAEGGAGVRELPLEPGLPVLVTVPHAGYCPDGPHAGVAFVVERDEFETEYRDLGDWTGVDGG